MVLLAFLLLWCAPAMAGELPAVAGTSVAGAAMQLPRDLPTEPTLVVFSFRRAHADPLDAWVDAARDAGVGCVEVVLIEGAPGFVRPLIVRGLERRDGGTARQARTLVATAGGDAMLAALGTDDAQPVALLVRRDGGVLWQHAGAPDAASRARLGQLVAAVKEPPAAGGGPPDEPAPAD